MAINVSVQHNGGLLPDIIPVDPRSLPSSGNSFKYHVEVLSLQPMKQYIITTTLFDDGHHIIYSKGKDQPGKVANPARGHLNKKNEFLPVPVRA